MSERVDCVVVGAGVIGLAIGRELAQAGREVVVVERNGNIGEETSARNSEVIHAGLYYPPGSLKARLCVAGKQMLYEYCDAKRIPHRRCGKLIVATEASRIDGLKQIAERAGENGVDDLILLEPSEIAEREPAVRGEAGLWSPSTGIVDSHGLMLALTGDLEAAGGMIATGTDVTAIDTGPNGIRLELLSHGDATELVATTVVNSAGLGAGRLAAQTTGADDYAAPPTFLAKGNYFLYERPSPFRSLVYPLPVAGGLGIHATLDLGGKLRFGPDVEWVDRIDYSVDTRRKAAFAESIRRYWPELDEDGLVPGYAGIRPKLAGPDESWADFRIDVAASGASRQLVHLLGIESPGLTSALAIAGFTREKIEAAAC